MLCFSLEERMGDVLVRPGGILKSAEMSLLLLTYTSTESILWDKVPW